MHYINLGLNLLAYFIGVIIILMGSAWAALLVIMHIEEKILDLLKLQGLFFDFMWERIKKEKVDDEGI